MWYLRRESSRDGSAYTGLACVGPDELRRSDHQVRPRDPCSAVLRLQSYQDRVHGEHRSYVGGRPQDVELIRVQISSRCSCDPWVARLRAATYRAHELRDA